MTGQVGVIHFSIYQSGAAIFTKDLFLDYLVCVNKVASVVVGPPRGLWQFVFGYVR